VLVGQRKLSLTADTYPHVLSDGRELDLDVLLASRLKRAAWARHGGSASGTRIPGIPRTMLQGMVGIWALRRAVRLLTADDPRPLRTRLTAEAKRILMGAAITLALLVAAAIALLAVLIVAVS
jgi:hypothetical protein